MLSEIDQKVLITVRNKNAEGKVTEKDKESKLWKSTLWDGYI